MNALPDVLHVRIARFLDAQDVARWLVLALELGDRDLARLLRFRSLYPLATQRTIVLRVAACHGCFRAAASLATPSLLPRRALRLGRKLPASVVYDAIEQAREPVAVVAWLHFRAEYSMARAMELAARRRSLPLLQWLARHPRRDASVRVRVLAPWDEKLRAMCWVETTPLRYGVATRKFLYSEPHGLAPVECQNEYGDGPVRLYPAMDFAARIGDLQLLQTLHDDPQVAWVCTTDAMDAAAARGDLEMAQWLHANRSEGCTSQAMDDAARFGHVEMVKWLYYVKQEKGTPAAFSNAAVGGHLEILRWQMVRYVHFEVTQTALYDTVRAGHLDVVQWVDETMSRTQISRLLMKHSVEVSDLKLAQWLSKRIRDEKIERSFTIREAVQNGNMELAQWWHSESRVLPADVLSMATKHNHLALAKWLVRVLPEDELRVDRNTLIVLAERGFWEMLLWLLDDHRSLCVHCEFVRHGLLGGELKKPVEQRLTWLPRYTRILLQKVPEVVLQESRLAEWSAANALEDVLRIAWRYSHPKIDHRRLLTVLVKSMTTGSDVVEEILHLRPDLVRTPLVEWAAAYSHLDLLTTMRQFAHPREFIVFTPAIVTACRLRLIDVLEWAAAQDMTEKYKYLWVGGLSVATRHRCEPAALYIQGILFSDA